MEWVASNLMNKHKSIIAELVTNTVFTMNQIAKMHFWYIWEIKLSLKLLLNYNSSKYWKPKQKAKIVT